MVLRPGVAGLLGAPKRQRGWNASTLRDPDHGTVSRPIGAVRARP
jgi:hypothetical protein